MHRSDEIPRRRFRGGAVGLPGRGRAQPATAARAPGGPVRRLRTAQSIGTARAALAAQGGDIGSGSAPDLLGDIARSGAADALAARDDAAQKAWRLRLQAMNAENDAGLAGASAANEDRRAGEAWRALGVGSGQSLLGSPNSPFNIGKWL